MNETKPTISLAKKAMGKASWYTYLALAPLWTRKQPGFFPVKHGQLFLEPREGWRAYLRAHDAWEPEVREKLYHVLRPGDRVLDLGSNYGEFALQMADIVGENGKVVGVEMDPHYVKILHLVKEYNPILQKRFTIIGEALSNENNLAKIAKTSGVTPTFYFSDIEGAETLLLDQLFSDPRWLKDSPRFLLELHPEIYGKEKQNEIIQKFQEAGYTADAVDDKHYYFFRKSE